MNLSAEQYFALGQIGIPVWTQRREINLDTKLASEPETFSHIDYTKPWLVLIDKPLSAAEKRLLRAIFASIDTQFEKLQVVEQQHTQILMGFSVNKTVALVLGEYLASKLNLQPNISLACQQFDSGLLTVVGPSLQQLLTQPERKAKMWQTIVQLRNLKAR